MLHNFSYKWIAYPSEITSSLTVLCMTFLGEFLQKVGIFSVWSEKFRKDQAKEVHVKSTVWPGSSLQKGGVEAMTVSLPNLTCVTSIYTGLGQSQSLVLPTNHSSWCYNSSFSLAWGTAMACVIIQYVHNLYKHVYSGRKIGVIISWSVCKS